MGINVTVGLFVDISEAEYLESKDFIDHHREQFKFINRYLKSIGLPEHHEPDTFGKDISPVNLTATKELYPFRDFTEEVAARTDLRFPHLLNAAHSNGGIFLPIPFKDPLMPDESFGIEYSLSSAYQLHCECWLLAHLYGLGEDFDQPVVDCLLDPLANINLTPKDFNLIYEHGSRWSNGAGACSTLYFAAQFAIKHKAAVVVF